MNEQAFFQLSQDAVSRLAERYGTPLLVLSLEQIEKNYDILRTHIPQMRIHYAMKANPDLRILETMIDKNAVLTLQVTGKSVPWQALVFRGKR